MQIYRPNKQHTNMGKQISTVMTRVYPRSFWSIWFSRETRADCNTGHVATLAPMPSRKCQCWIARGYFPPSICACPDMLPLHRLSTWLKNSRENPDFLEKKSETGASCNTLYLVNHIITRLFMKGWPTQSEFHLKESYVILISNWDWGLTMLIYFAMV